MRLRTRRHSNERLLVLLGLGLASALSVGLEVVRELHYDDPGFRFLLWNLTLAWIPLVVALVVYDCYRRGAGLLVLSPAIALWLIFLPNAPYIVTDFIHLEPRGIPLWYDGALLSAFAQTGVLLGFVSLYLIHAVVRDRFGVLAGWLFALGALPLTSAGMYVGRFLQWNSWDLLVRPGKLLAQIATRVDETTVVHAAGLTLLLTALLAATYLAFYTLVGLRIDPQRSQPLSTRRS
jgi:uncharacterized membrane protein